MSEFLLAVLPWPASLFYPVFFAAGWIAAKKEERQR